MPGLVCNTSSSRHGKSTLRSCLVRATFIAVSQSMITRAGLSPSTVKQSAARTGLHNCSGVRVVQTLSIAHIEQANRRAVRKIILNLVEWLALQAVQLS